MLRQGDAAGRRQQVGRRPAVIAASDVQLAADRITAEVAACGSVQAVQELVVLAAEPGAENLKQTPRGVWGVSLRRRRRLCLSLYLCLVLRLLRVCFACSRSICFTSASPRGRAALAPGTLLGIVVALDLAPGVLPLRVLQDDDLVR